MNYKTHTGLEKLTGKHVPEQPALRKIYAAEIIFGSPKKNCAGAGICKVNSPVSHHPGSSSCLNCNRAIALIEMDQTGFLTFRFVRKSMNDDIIDKYFENGLFLMEAPFLFQGKCWEPLSPTILYPGIYPVEKSDEFLTVRLKTTSPLPQ